VGGEVVHDDDVPRLEHGNQDLFYIGLKAGPFMAPPRTIGAVMPDSRRPAVNVVVFQ